MALKVHHLNCATLNTSAGLMVCHCLLVESSDGLVLVDTGLGTMDISEPKLRSDFRFRFFAKPILNINETALYQIQKLGFSKEEVKHIVLTHLHVDHAGGLSDFPDATIHALRYEYNNIYDEEKIQDGYNLRQFAHELNWKIHDIYGQKWNGFNKSNIIEGSEDIVLVPLRGHSSGHCGVAIHSDKGWILHCGDAYYHRNTIKKGIDKTPFSIKLLQYFVDFNTDLRYATQQRLIGFFQSNKHEIQFICSHDAVEFEACSKGINPNFI